MTFTQEAACPQKQCNDSCQYWGECTAIAAKMAETKLVTSPNIVNFRLLVTSDTFQYGWVKNSLKYRIIAATNKLKQFNKKPDTYVMKAEYVWLAATEFNIITILQDSLRALAEEEERRKRNDA
jgi:hypothetical protein